MSSFEREECAFERHVGELSEYVVGGHVELSRRLRLPPVALRVELPLERALQLLDSARPPLQLLLIRRQDPLQQSTVLYVAQDYHSSIHCTSTLVLVLTEYMLYPYVIRSSTYVDVEAITSRKC